MAAPPDSLLHIPRLYHFTDTRNLPLIREHGGIFSTARLREMGVQFHPGGNQWSLDQDVRFGMDRFVHLCFAVDHPMEHRARERGDILVAKYLYIDRSILYEPGVVFAPDVANGVNLRTCSIEEARGRIDYDILYTRTNWRDPAIQARRQAAERCEILVPDHVPMRFIREFPNG
jgi:hypothetical protein